MNSVELGKPMECQRKQTETKNNKEFIIEMEETGKIDCHYAEIVLLFLDIIYKKYITIRVRSNFYSVSIYKFI